MSYFLVSYAHSSGFGMTNFTCDNCYLNLDLCIQQIQERGSKDVVPIAITELNEQDFKQFNEKK